MVISTAEEIDAEVDTFLSVRNASVRTYANEYARKMIFLCSRRATWSKMILMDALSQNWLCRVKKRMISTLCGKAGCLEPYHL